MYTPLKDIHEARAWADQTVVSVLEPTAPHAFIASKIETNVSYKLANGAIQPVKVYLIRPDITHNAFAIFFHGMHAVIDTRASLKALSLLLESMSDPNIESISGLQWGKEFENLPSGPIKVTGGPREDWKTHGTALLMKVGAHFANETVRFNDHQFSLRDETLLMYSTAIPHLGSRFIEHNCSRKAT